MTSNEVKLLDGRVWTEEDFLKYYLSRPQFGGIEVDLRQEGGLTRDVGIPEGILRVDQPAQDIS